MSTAVRSTPSHFSPLNNLGRRRRTARLAWIQFHGGDAMVNKVTLIGNLAADPEVKATPKGTYVAKLRLATNTYIGKDDEGTGREQTEFHHLLAFGKTAEFAGQYLHKGRLGYADGRLQTNTWEDTGGQKRSRTEIVVDGLTPLGPEPQEAAPQAESRDRAGPRAVTCESMPEAVRAWSPLEFPAAWFPGPPEVSAA